MKEKKSEEISNLRLFRTILLKDLKLEFRQASDLISIILFDIISVFIFSTAFTVGTGEQSMPAEIFVIQIWIVVFFTLLFIIAKLFVKEKESGTLDGLISSPTPINTLFFSKIVFSMLIFCLIEAIIFLFGLFISNPSGISMSVPIWLFILLAILLPTVNLCITGTLVSALSMYVKHKSFILPVLLFPILLPVASPIILINIKLMQGYLFSEILIEFLFLSLHTLLMFAILILVADLLLIE